MLGLKVFRNLHIQNTEIVMISKQFRFGYATLTNKLDSTVDSKQSSTEPINKYYDIVVCGGGIVGTSMASALGKSELFSNHKIALIESSQERKPYKLPSLHSNRVSALNKSTVDFLKNIGCFEFIEQERFCHVKKMQVWEACTDSVINFQNNDDNDLAIIVENDLVQASLDKRVKDFKNIEILYSSQLKDILKEDGDFVKLKLNDGSFINTKLLIGSDGPNSFIRKKIESSLLQFEYDQLAIVATLKIAKDENVTAWQRFLPTGPIALLPLNHEYSSLVWSVEKKLAKDLMKLSDEEFVNKLNHAFVDESYKNQLLTNIEKLLDSGMDFIASITENKNIISSKVNQLPPKVEACAPNSRASYPLGFCHANNYIKNRVVLIGDAAHRIHPLAGQGVNLGFGDIICLMDKLNDNAKSGLDLGSMIYLEDYEKVRQREVYPKILFIHFLNEIYSNRKSLIQAPTVLLRSLGLTMTNRLNLIKNFYMERAMK